MKTAIEFIETAIFTKQVADLLSDEELRHLQCELIQNPTKGDIIQGTGGLRKVRVATKGSGKSGGGRVIYLVVSKDKIFLVLAYKKGVKDTLTNEEKNQLKSMVQLLKDTK